MVVTYYGKPIETIQHGINTIEYCRWDDGFRLLSVNKIPHQHLSNYEFSYFLNVLITGENYAKKEIHN